MYTNIWQRFCVSYQTKTGDTRQSPSLCWGASWDSLEEIPHAHADLVQSFLHAVVVPILFLFFVIFLKLLWERVVPPSGFLVFFFPNVVAVVNVQLVFFFKLCDAVSTSVMVFFMFFVLRFWFGFLCFRCVYNAAETHI